MFTIQVSESGTGVLTCYAKLQGILGDSFPHCAVYLHDQVTFRCRPLIRRRSPGMIHKEQGGCVNPPKGQSYYSSRYVANRCQLFTVWDKGLSAQEKINRLDGHAEKNNNTVLTACYVMPLVSFMKFLSKISLFQGLKNAMNGWIVTVAFLLPCNDKSLATKHPVSSRPPPTSVVIFFPAPTSHSRKKGFYAKMTFITLYPLV